MFNIEKLNILPRCFQTLPSPVVHQCRARSLPRYRFLKTWTHKHYPLLWHPDQLFSLAWDRKQRETANLALTTGNKNTSVNLQRFMCRAVSWPGSVMSWSLWWLPGNWSWLRNSTAYKTLLHRWNKQHTKCYISELWRCSPVSSLSAWHKSRLITGITPTDPWPLHPELWFKKHCVEGSNIKYSTYVTLLTLRQNGGLGLRRWSCCRRRTTRTATLQVRERSVTVTSVNTYRHSLSLNEYQMTESIQWLL